MEKQKEKNSFVLDMLQLHMQVRGGLGLHT